MKKLVPALLAGVLLVVGASVALAQTDESDTSSTTVEESASDDAAPQRRDRGQVLEDVLDDLVADGTLTQEQADAVTAALAEKKADFQAQRDELRAAWDEAWADDVLTEDEVAELAGDSAFSGRVTDPDGPLAEYWEDGQLTREELAEAREELGFGHRGHRGGRFGADSESAGTQDSASSVFGTAGDGEA